VWKKTIFILNYDENDGYFDHVPPFVAPHPRRKETGLVSRGIDTGLEYVELEQELKRKPADEARDSPIGLGYRVPMIIASPWSRGGFVCSQVFDHTSPLQFLEKFLTRKTGTEIKEPNINQWRRAVCGDLTSAFRPNADEEIKALSYPTRDEFVAEIHRAQFKELPTGFKKLSPADIHQIQQSRQNSPVLPRQEAGVRPSCALPYELAVDGMLSDDRTRFTIRFEASAELFGKAAAGSPFIVYAYYGAGDVRIRNYAVTAGDQLEDSWTVGDFADERYHLAVYGPNGFYREFRGDAGGPRIDVRLQPARTPADAGSLSGNVELHVSNRDSRPLNAEIADVSYNNAAHRLALAPGESATREIDAQRSYGWYDLRVRIVGNERFECRLAGRMETGKPSISDPVIGHLVS
jgi:phospholipase C